MQEPVYTRIAAAEAPGLRAELRVSPRHSTEMMTWTAPIDVLTFRFGPKARVWSRMHTGAGEFTLDGPLTFRPRFATWQTRSDGAPQVSLLAHFEQPLKYVAPDDRPVFSIDDTAMFSLMRMLHDEIRDPGFSSPALIESIGKLLRIKLRRLMKGAGGPSLPAYRLSIEKLKLIEEYVAALKGRSPTVTEVADLCQMSARTLLRQLRERTGMTVAGYIAQVQLDRSKALLIGSEMLVKQIAFDVGFADPNHFSNAFKRMTGYSPLEFRALSRS